MTKIFKYVVYDVMRSNLIIAYTILLFAFSFGIIWFGGDESKAIVSLLQIVLLVVPLISIIFGTIHYYNSREFVELLLSQPITRRRIFTGEYFGLSVTLALAFLVGTGVPLLINGISAEGVYLVITGVFLTFIFTALAFNTSVRSNDKAKGIGKALLLWFYFAVLFDGIILLILFYFNDYPLEKVVIALTALNPVDLGRVLILLKLDTSALMGYTGALYQKFFGSGFGIVFSLSMLTAWMLVPLWIAKRKFGKKDL